MALLAGKLVQIWFILSYAVIFGIVKSLQIILRLTVEPFSKGICRKLEKYLFMAPFQYLVFLLDWWSEIRLILHTDGDAKDNLFGKENAICFMNTQSNFLQQLIMAKLSDNINMVQYNDNNVFHWSTGNHFESNNCATYGQISGNKYWCVLFPENDDSTTKCTGCGDFNKIGATFPTFQNIISLKGRHHYSAIYDISIVVTGDWMEITPRNVFDKASLNVHVYMKRIPIDEMPEQEFERKLFLEELNAEKKFSVHEFLENGEFLECQTGINIIEQYEFEPSVRSAVSFAVCSAITLLVFGGLIFLF